MSELLGVFNFLKKQYEEGYTHAGGLFERNVCQPLVVSGLALGGTYALTSGLFGHADALHLGALVGVGALAMVTRAQADLAYRAYVEDADAASKRSEHENIRISREIAERDGPLPTLRLLLPGGVCLAAGAILNLTSIAITKQPMPPALGNALLLGAAAVAYTPTFAQISGMAKAAFDYVADKFDGDHSPKNLSLEQPPAGFKASPAPLPAP